MACVKGFPDCGDPHFLAEWVKECSPLRPAVANDFFYSNSTFCEETLMADNKRCAHPSCTCPAAADSKYCYRMRGHGRRRMSIAGAGMRAAAVTFTSQ